MQLKDYLISLENFAVDHDNCPLVYSGDDEGNHFQQCYYSPSLGYYRDGEFIPMEDAADLAFEAGETEDDYYSDYTVVICIN